MLMNALKEPERINLAEGLTLLKSHLPSEEAKSCLRRAFIRKAFPQSPSFAFEYDEADIDWTTGSVKILERTINGKTPAERAAVRRDQSKQLVEALDRWLRQQRALLSAKSDLVKAINYGLNRWAAFTQVK
jgi:Transposase IS66 family